MRTDGSALGTASPHVVWLGDPRCTDPGLVGPKAAHLSRLSHRYPVPTAFCVTAAAFRSCAASLTVDEKLRAVIAEAYTRLAQSGAAVAVRSSALEEDSRDASFAGQLASHLNVNGVDAVVTALEATWRSSYSESALVYRRAHDLATSHEVAVLVQRLVHADASGVAFSLDPVTGDSLRVVINATWGLGESLVNGTIDPDRYVFDKSTLALLAAEVGTKERMTIASDPAGYGTGTREVATPTFLRSRPALSPEEQSAVATLTRDLEVQLGWPVDVEFAFAPEGLSLLQCRPVTTSSGQSTNLTPVDIISTGRPSAAEDAI